MKYSLKRVLGLVLAVLTVFSMLTAVTVTADGGDYTGGEVYFEPVTGHTLTLKSVKQPTCTEGGYSVYYCAECDKEYNYDYTDIIPHTESDWIIDVQPTEQSVGHKYKECTVCKKVLEEEEIPKTSHTAGDINGDGEVNNKDLTRLLQYITGIKVSVDAATLDVNGDKSVNNKDLVRLFKYLSGFDVEIYFNADYTGGQATGGGSIYLPEVP